MSTATTHPVTTYGGGDGDGAVRRGVLVGFLAEFDSSEALKAAARQVRDAGYRDWDTHSPFPVHGIDDAMGIRMTRLPILVFAGGLAGTLTGIVLQWWTNATNYTQFPGVDTFVQGYNFMVSGKPYWSFPANIPVIFELTVLFAALTAALAMLMRNNLPNWTNPIFNAKRFARATTDRFFVRIDATDPKFHAVQTERFLSGLSAAVERVEDLPGDSATPKWIKRVTLVAATVGLIPLILIAVARNSTSPNPRIHLIQDMDNQERYKPQQENAAFADRRAMRPAPGATPENPLGLTVARGQTRLDEHYYRGYRIAKDAAGQDAPVFFDTFPSQVKIDRELIHRGQNRFTVYCAPCHGLDGSGNGMVNNRAVELGGGWVQAQDLHDDERRARPAGQLFNSITAGIRSMPPYGDVVPEADRWAIVAYIKTLQRSTAVRIDDPVIPQTQRDELKTRRPEPK